MRGEPPPKIVDELIRTTWHAVVDGQRLRWFYTPPNRRLIIGLAPLKANAHNA
jgi:hypothetical protein